MTQPIIPFVEFPKIARFNREVIVTEKIDGTNAGIFIPELNVCECGHSSQHLWDGCQGWQEGGLDRCRCEKFQPNSFIYAGSCTKWITPEEDNAGFAKWVQKNKIELLKLGPGHHFGEWWGQGIQRNYGLKEKRLSLFNVGRWGPNGKDVALRPVCCNVVPELWRGTMEQFTGEDALHEVMQRLRTEGSVAAPGFKNPEGIVIYHVASQQLFKKTLLRDESPKGKVGP